MLKRQGVSVRSALTHPSLHVVKKQADRSVVREFTQLTGVSSTIDLGIFNSDIDTLACSLLERMYYCKVGNEFLPPPQPTKRLVVERLKKFRNLLIARVGRVVPLTEEEVVETYTGRKKTIYQNALLNLQHRGLSRRDAHSCVFVKVEKGNTQKAPRAIQPRKPEYNLVVGKYIKALEHRLYKAMGRVFGDGPTVMKGYTVQEVATIARGKWDNTVDCVCVGLDATKFDMHVSDVALEWEHSVYNTIFKSSELKRLLTWQVDNYGHGFAADGKLKYSVRGRRFSGDMNTALGNCLLMVGMVYAYCDERNIPVKLMNNGDDCMVFLSRPHLEAFMVDVEPWFLGMGFRMTVENPVYEFEQLEFCQMRPIQVVNGWVMVRNIKTALTKDTMCLLPFDGQQSYRKWLGAVGECGLALCSGVPIMQSFYEMYNRHGLEPGALVNSNQMVSGLRLMRGNLESRWSQVTPQSRLSVFKAWGITPDEQVAIELYFDSMVLNLSHVDTEYIPTLFNGISLSW